MACLKEMVQIMYKVLDQEATEVEEREFFDHINTCSTCREHFLELKQTESLVKGLETKEPSEGFTQAVMAKLPQPHKKSRRPAKVWMRHHPIITAAACFIILMSGYLFSLWNQDSFNAVVQGKGHVQYDGHTVIVPKGEVIKGDLIVKNGKVKIEGKVQGDVVLVNSESLLASAGHVTGDIEQVDQIMEWIWYHIKSIFTMFAAFDYEGT
ncbi:anti-sigma factor RsiW [Scopulibacillus darangshiensis]|uniref:Anti-sigma factor RsiW n=1 Tax=Scopulibacillus darangshiensis TaxID=442528 RepID=A0A4R2P2A4_9BACL|nr:anti-sigma factor [Scopulibacillus darangshiensis]TCP28810.1 anti-sigma factor RsiW [Scopulibacillus darangshiensis]